MHESNPDVVEHAVLTAVNAVRAGAPLGPCRRLFTEVDERCLEPTTG
jgi:hypothetical protein